MTLYADSSAFVKLVVEEPGSEVIIRAVGEATAVQSAWISYLEVHSALARMREGRRIDDGEHRSSRHAFEAMWQDAVHIELTARLLRQAAQLAERHVLRGYDAVQLAAAISGETDARFAAWDARLRAAAAREGFDLVPKETS